MPTVSNVWEWCSDRYGSDYYEDSPIEDPTGPITGSNRVFRGGSWNGLARGCRSAYRFRYLPGIRYDFSGGFRVALLPVDASGK